MIAMERYPQYMHYLKSRSEFSLFNEEEINILQDNMRVKEYKKGQILFDEMDARNRFFFLIEGLVRIERFDSSGEFGFYSYIKENLAFPYRGMFTDENYPYMARAMTDIEIVYFPMATFEKMLRRNNEMTIMVLREMGLIISQTEDQLQRMVTSSAKDRIIQAINIFSEQLGADSTAEKRLIPYPITIKELAFVSGTTRETAGQVVKDLVHANKLLFVRKYFTLLKDWNYS